MTDKIGASIQQKHAQKIRRNLITTILSILLLNGIAYFFYAQYDLTSDQRFTTTKSTKRLLKELKDDIEVTVFLTGDAMPAAFQRLSNSTLDVLKSFRGLSNKKVQFHLSDPQGDDTLVYNTLVRFRMQGIPVTINAGKKGTEQKMIFPWALVHNKKTNVALPVFLQEANIPQLSRTVLNKSEVLLEYNLANAIAQVSKAAKEKIGFITGNGEMIDLPIMSALGALGTYYQLDTINLQQVQNLPPDYHTLIINNPTHNFTDIDKFKIDQFLVGGGNLIMNINGATGTLDSFANNGNYNSLPNDVGLSDILFHYGLRLNTNLIADASEHEMIPLSASGNVSESVMYPFVYYPKLKVSDNHPITKNLDRVLARIASSIDILNAENTQLNTTVLLSTSKYTKTEATPTPLSLTNSIIEINPAEYMLSEVPVAVLTEGTFVSIFDKQRPVDVDAFIQQNQINLQKSGTKTGKLLLIGDGEIFNNEFTPNGPMDLGEYKYSSYKYDNKSFLLNCVEYLSNPNHLLEARSKTFSNRILDPKRVQRERSTWQIINVLVPVSIIVLLGSIWFFIRKKKYG